MNDIITDLAKTQEIKAAATELMDMISNRALQLDLGAVVVITIDWTGKFTAYEMASNIDEKVVVDAILDSVQHIFEG